jgi:hypothetical protein
MANNPDNFYVWAKWLNESAWAGNRPTKLGSHLLLEQILLGVGLVLQVLDHGLYTEVEERSRSPNTPDYVWQVEQTSFDLVLGLAMKLAGVVDT